MGSTGGTENSDVNGRLELVRAELEADPCRFQFFQAVRLIERLSGGNHPVGQFVNPKNECVRFAVHNALAFPASQIQKIEWF